MSNSESPTHASPALIRASRRWAGGALIFYLAVTAIYTHPLAARLTTGIPSDPWDPSFFASILKWNATRLPFSSAWWSAPLYYPTPDVAAFTETLVGLSPIASPIIWTTGHPLLAYNVTFFLSWALSAWALYLLVAALTGEPIAALLAGIVFAFNPYRTTEIAHVQLLSTEWLPLIFLALHQYLRWQRVGWLWLFGIAWLLTSLTNGHFMLFGAVLIGLWLLYFASPRALWPAALKIAAVWTLASLPLVPILLKYQAVHDRFGLVRGDSEILAYSAQPASFAHASSYSWFWPRLIAHGKDDLFPGATALVLVVIAAAVLIWQRRTVSRSPTWWRVTRAVLAIATGAASAATIAALVHGPLLITRGETVLFKMTDLNRALLILVVCGGTLVWTTPGIRRALADRSSLVFYTVTIGVCALLACGPVLRVDEAVLLSPAPYRWLMALPGFRELRVPPRFWMLGTMCLATAAGLALSRLRPSAPPRRVAFFSVVAVALFIDSWIPALPMNVPPAVWPIERPDSSVPILELPLGPDWDFAATYRAAIHTRRVVNGVSGYHPLYYIGLGVGLAARDPLTLAAVTSFGPLDVVITKADDPDGAIRRFVAGSPGATEVAENDTQVLFRLPKGGAEPTVGKPLEIRSIIAGRNNQDARFAYDGRLETGWDDYPQRPDGWVLVDIGVAQEVGGVTLALADRYLDYPRHLVIEVSEDGSSWIRTWDAPSMGPLMMAYVRAPRVADMRFAFRPQRARYVRLRQTETTTTSWRISELAINAPANASPGVSR